MSEESIFAAAVALPDPAARASYLDQACAGNLTLRQHLDALLAAHFSADPVFDPATRSLPSPPSRRGAEGEGTESTRDPDGTRLAPTEPLGEAGQVIAGRYKLIESIGEGGMGSVWMAEQREPVKRLVAVKLIKAGMDSKAVLARFEAERQALAVMDHPNIAKVLDGGTWSPSPLAGEGLGVGGRSIPYFVMELVKGTPITAFCDARRLTPRQRLELFVPVCSAIQHAHMKGVIHRDIKPSNVLVALYDDKPIPKVIDFGIAKATGQALTDKTLHTGFGAVVGTPEYMSPEQASLNNLDVDTRSDVYSLGVLLYELLVGSPPFTRKELEQAGLLEMLRVVREAEPQRPSAKLSTAAARPSIAASRGLEPAALTKVLRSELDWLVMKALEKDRNRRYDSANGLAADVGRYLAGEAVTAVPPSLGYRVRKWVRKNRGLVTAAGVVAGTLTVGIAGTTWGLVRAEQEAERARGEEQKVRDEQTKTKEALDAAERNLVHSYLRPIGFNTNGFDQAELIALDELARQDDDRVKLLFLREALADGERVLRIARRAERVIQAAVGPSLRRRTAALELTSTTQRDTTADPRVRLCACWLAIELGSDDLPALKEGLDTLLAGKSVDLSNFTGRLPARIQASKASTLTDALIAALDKMTDQDALSAARDGLSALAPRLDPAAAARGFDALIAAQGKSKVRNIEEAAVALDNFASQLDPTVVQHKLTQACDNLVRNLYNINGDAGHGYARSLHVLAPRLDPAAAARGFDALIAAQGKVDDVHWSAEYALSALAPRLDSTAASRAADALVAVLGRTTKSRDLRVFPYVLAALAPKLDPAVAAKVFDGLVALLGKAKDESTKRSSIYSQVAVAPRLDRAAAAQRFDALFVELGNANDGFQLRDTGLRLAALAPRLDPSVVQLKLAQATDALIAALRKTNDSSELEAVGKGLAALAPRLDSPTATRVFDALVAVLGRTTAAHALRAAADGLVALVPRLDPAVAIKRFDALVAILGKTDKFQLEAAEKVLVALAPRLDPTDASKGFDALVAVLGKVTDCGHFQAAGHVLAALAPRRDPTAVAQPTAVRLANSLEVQQRRLPDVASEAQRRLYQDDDINDVVCEPFLVLWPWLPRVERVDRLHRIIYRMLDYGYRSFDYALDRPRSTIYPPAFIEGIGLVDSVEFLAELLRDSGCVGDFQSAVLARLEELAYPQPEQAAVFVGLAAAPQSPLAVPGLKLADDDHRRQHRRFRTVSDAARWLADHHPEIDLDRPYHKAAK